MSALCWPPALCHLSQGILLNVEVPEKVSGQAMRSHPKLAPS